jgi:hypothetical protein
MHRHIVGRNLLPNDLASFIVLGGSLVIPMFVRTNQDDHVTPRARLSYVDLCEVDRLVRPVHEELSMDSPPLYPI